MTRDGLEIERKWILDALPERLRAFESGRPDERVSRMHLRQGYLRPATSEELEDAGGGLSGPVRFGRIRSIRTADGLRHVQTVKSGEGLVRREIERELDPEAFEAAWPETQGRRIEKVRWAVREPDGLVWEIDRFEHLDLVLAEVEVPDEASAARIGIPSWLASSIVREVTREPAFTNAEIAFRSGLLGGG